MQRQILRGRAKLARFLKYFLRNLTQKRLSGLIPFDYFFVGFRYDDVLKKLEVLDGDTKAMGRLLTSTELAKYLPKAEANDASHGQTELAEVISVLKSQYDKVENVLTKQYDKLETIVDKLELDGAKKKDLVQVVKVGDTKENKITILVENDQMGEVVDLLKSCLLEKNIEMNVVVKVGKFTL